MKKLGVILGSAVLLAACGYTTVGEAAKEKGFTNGYDWKLNITKDKSTGCKYIIFEGSRKGGITPLLNENGQPQCKNTKGEKDVK